MRWSIIRIIWARELRDQLRDRRTVFMIAVLPVVLYPLAGIGLMQLAFGYLDKPRVIGIAGSEYLPNWVGRPRPAVPAATWLAALPGGVGVPLTGVDRLSAAASLVQAQRLAYPSLLERGKDGVQIAAGYFDNQRDADSFLMQLQDMKVPDLKGRPESVLGEIERSALNNRNLDLLVVVPPRFLDQLQAGQRPTLYVLTREGDDQSRLALNRLNALLDRWKEDLRAVRMDRKGLPAEYDNPLEVWDPDRAKPGSKRASEDLFKLIAHLFPFVLVMWSLAGALYPAVDLCAGEKERGTMETLLISPATREEIVWGKFLTIWVFSAATALLNLASMGLTTWQFSKQIAHGAFQLPILFWGILLLLPLSAFFSAMCLSVGVYARSTKEGQYYLMPLFLMTLPLVFLTLAPGVELNPFYSMVPVTGVALLLQDLMLAGTPQGSHWLYFIPVLAPMIIYSWLALRWAIEQFQREEVLFREAERLDLALWFRHLRRDKEALPSVGQALFCFGLILAFRWLAFNVGSDLSLLTRTGISHLAFVAAPPLFMALLLTTRPTRGLNLHWPPWWAWLAAGLLGIVMTPPFAELTRYILNQVPALRVLLEQYHPLTGELQHLQDRPPPTLGPRLQYLLVLGLLPAVCEEIAFRGFILSGLTRRFRPWTAIALSSFLFALYQMNVFQFAPHFLFGMLLGLLVLRIGSVLVAMVFHLVFNCLLIGPGVFPEAFQWLGRETMGGASLSGWWLLVNVLCTALALVVLLAVWRKSVWKLPEADGAALTS
jgi:sodium transport system permease protein